MTVHFKNENFTPLFVSFHYINVNLLALFQNCINQFTATAQNKRCSFIGNVNVGKDVKVSELLQSYDAVVLVSL